MENQEETLNSAMEGFVKPTPAQKTVEDITEHLGSEEEKKLPVTYAERLAYIKVTMDEAMSIVDEIVTEDCYKETFNLSKKQTVTIVTRKGHYNDYMIEALRKKVPLEDPVGYSQLSSKLQLAGALFAYGNDKFEPLDSALTDDLYEANVKKRMGFVNELAGPVYLALISRVANFDIKVATVLSEGYEENF